MSEFDPYLKWLGIRETTRPINHYRLLGLDLFEDDPDVISMAADRQMTHIRTYQNGPNGDLSQQILNELARARRCLLMRDKKVQYDAQLRLKIDRSSVASPPPKARQVERESGGHPEAGTPPMPTAMPLEAPSIRPTVVPSSTMPVNVGSPDSDEQAAGDSGFGIRADANARTKSKRRERKNMLWGLFGWASGAVAAVGVSAAILGSGLLDNFRGEKNEVVDLDVESRPEQIADIFNPEKDNSKKVSPPKTERIVNLNKVRSEDRNPDANAMSNTGANAIEKTPETTSRETESVEFTLDNLSAYPRANPADFAVFGEVKQRLRDKKTVKFESSAPPKDVRFSLVAEEVGILIGMAATTDRQGNLTWVRPVFHDGFHAFAGSAVGKDLLKKTGSGGYISIAKPGYAVGGIEISTTSPARYFRLQFMKLDMSGLDVRETYWGPWVGVEVGPSRKITNKQGLPIVGLHGSLEASEQISTLGLVAAYENTVPKDLVAKPTEKVTIRQPRKLDFDPLLDLTLIVGIGAKTEAVLKANGISTVKALAGLSPQQVQSVIEREGVFESNDIGLITTWIVQAKKIAGDPSAISLSTEAMPELQVAIKKLPEPNARERSVAKKNFPESVNEILNAELNSKGAVATAADRLVFRARTIGDPAIQYVVLEKAEEMAIASGDAVVVVSAIREIDDHFEIDFWKRIQKSIDKAASNTSAQTVFGFKDAIDELIEQATEDGLYSQAGKLLSIAIRSAKSSYSTDLVQEYERIEDEVKFLSNLRKQNSAALETLATDAEDARAHLHLGNFLLVCDDDVETAMRHWEKSANEKFMLVAELESADLDSKVAKLIKLADAWRNLVKGSKQTPMDRKCLERAKDLYREASRSLAGREQQIVDNKAQEVSDLLRGFSKGFSKGLPRGASSAREALEISRREQMEQMQRDVLRRQMLQKERER